MKRFEVYRNIRQKALIYGLPVPLFALMMLSVIGCLLVVIFSFSLLVILGVIAWNLMLYIILIRITNNPQILHFGRVFPNLISNKKPSIISYED